MLLFMQSGHGIGATDNPAAWLYRLDHDLEFHETLKRLCASVNGNRPRVAEAVLLLEQYIAFTAPVRSKLDRFGDDWEEAVRRLNNSRSVSQIRHVQHLLRATTTRKASY